MNSAATPLLAMIGLNTESRPSGPLWPSSMDEDGLVHWPIG
jgi:hypothetical protein